MVKSECCFRLSAYGFLFPTNTLYGSKCNRLRKKGGGGGGVDGFKLSDYYLV